MTSKETRRGLLPPVGFISLFSFEDAKGIFCFYPYLNK
ncbi:hypothetical protein BREVNS_1934 [Brevinematales bacterium NS]|nr:hypothetical protein BREVNS_1934 [Brevinematales bacterium NS]